MRLLKRLGLRRRHFVASRKQQATIQVHVGARDECTIIAGLKQHKVCRVIDMALTSKEATGVSYIDHQALLQAPWGAMRSQLMRFCACTLIA